MATLKQLMTLLSKEGLLENRAEIIKEWTSGRTDSAAKLTATEINAMCIVLEKNSIEEMDIKRKRLIASIFGMFNLMNKQVSMDYVKGIACRAAKVDKFNQISATRLVSLYNAFKNAQKDLTFTARMVEGFLNEQQSYN